MVPAPVPAPRPRDHLNSRSLRPRAGRSLQYLESAAGVQPRHHHPDIVGAVDLAAAPGIARDAVYRLVVGTTVDRRWVGIALCRGNVNSAPPRTLRLPARYLRCRVVIDRARGVTTPVDATVDVGFLHT